MARNKVETMIELTSKQTMLTADIPLK